MTNAPEKVWATGNKTTGSWNHTPLYLRNAPVQTGYTRTDIAQARIAELEKEVTDLKNVAISFCGPWAATYAKRFGLPDGHIHPAHYDILEHCGARMNDFTRAALKAKP
jgi:hypothetical protein